MVLQGITALFIGLMFMAGMRTTAGAAPPKTKKIVFIAGRKSHGPGAHEYEKGLRLLAHCLETAPNLQGFKTEVHLYGWPEDPKTLDDADAIVLYCDGSDHNETDHPLLVGDRLEQLRKQMKRGCGLVALHYAVFVPTKRGGPEFLDWLGGYFDYETGSAPNHWFSKIRNASETPVPASPDHPISRGLTPFPLTEEFYYNIKFRDNDPRRVPILQTAIPDEPQTQTVAWAVQRADGGRGFAFTGGHHHQNWQIENFRKMVLNAIVWAAHGEVPTGGVQSIIPPDMDDIRALVLTGYQMPAHDWKATTAAIQEILPRDSRIKLTIWQDPEKLAAEDLSRYDLIIQNYNNWDKPTLSSTSRQRLLAFVRNGGGLILIHFANGAWLDWPDYRRLSRRVWIEGKSSHDPYGPFKVVVRRPDHPLATGIADFDITDELYFHQQGDLPIDPLLVAHSKVTGQDEPLAYVYEEGKGRIFQCLLGHDAQAIRTPALAEILRRACAWVAKREVLPQPVQAVAHSPLIHDNALDARTGYLTAKGAAAYQAPPLKVECGVRLYGKSGYNILVANSAKESPRHWELYTEAGTGNFAVYVPGVTPPIFNSKVAIADGKYHNVAMMYRPTRMWLIVDGNIVLDQRIGGTNAQADIGPLYFGAYPPQNIGCDGLIYNTWISTFTEEDLHTIGWWRFDKLTDGRVSDLSSTHNPALVSAPATVAAPRPEPAPWPKIRAADSVDWPYPSGDKGGMRFSKLAQINRANVRKLQVAWTYHTGDMGNGTTIECAPVVVEGVMYLTTVKVDVVALDAATGREIWRYETRGGGVNRGIGYWSDGKPGGQRRILAALGNATLLSLDAKTGRPDPNFGQAGVVDERAGIERDISHYGYGSTSPPMIYENLAIIPYIVSEAQPGAPGDIRAFDVRTGKEVWRFHTVPRPGEFGNDTWDGDGWKDRTGVNPWAGYTLDEKRGILYCGTGSASSDFNGSDRHGANLFANCALALDARTGKRIWHYQVVHHDLWDHDNPCPPTLVTVKRNGKTIEAVAQCTKTGFCFLFDRVTGKPLYPIREVSAQPSDIPGELAYPTQPEPVKPPPLSPLVITDDDVTNISPEAHEYALAEIKKRRRGMKYIPPSLEGSIVAPGYHGGATWSGASFDPTNGLLYVNVNNRPSLIRLIRNSSGGYDFAGYDYFSDKQGYPAVKPPWGSLIAIDLSKGEFAWSVPLGAFPELAAKGVPQTGTQNFGGTIVTAGGLVFIGGSMDEMFHAFDKTTGKLLWETKLPAGGYATPSTYEVNGRQYVVIAAGGGGKPGTKSGDAFIAYCLP